MSPLGEWGPYCALCYQKLTPEQCAEDENGQKWDLCKGECARDAGITEKPFVGTDAAAAKIAHLKAKCPHKWDDITTPTTGMRLTHYRCTECGEDTYQ